MNLYEFDNERGPKWFFLSQEEQLIFEIEWQAFEVLVVFFQKENAWELKHVEWSWIEGVFLPFYYEGVVLYL